MYGIYVNSTQKTPYARAIVRGLKTLETRNSDVLRSLIGERVAVIETGCRSARIVGFCTIDGSFYALRREFQKYFSAHLVPPGSKYDAINSGKYCYKLSAPCEIAPVLLPANRINHGRSFCEFNENEVFSA